MAAVRSAVSFASDAGAHITFLNIEHAFPAIYRPARAIMDENAPAKFHQQADCRAHQILAPPKRSPALPASAAAY